MTDAWFYRVTSFPIFLTGIWDWRCYHQETGIFRLILSQKNGNKYSWSSTSVVFLQIW